MAEEVQKILVLDDSEQVRKLLKEALSNAGYQVDVGADGDEGIRKLRTGHYDLVLTDFDMPGATGTDVAKEVRRINLRTPVLILSGSMLEEADRLLTFLGVRQILHKPISPSDLCNAVEGAVTDKEEERREVGRLPIEDHCIILNEGNRYDGQITSLGLKGVSILTDSIPSLTQAMPFELVAEFPAGEVTLPVTPRYFIQKFGEMVIIGAAFVELSEEAEAAVKTRLEAG